MSATHDSFGESGSNWRSRRLSATGRSWLESVVQRNFRAVLAAMPFSCITRATVFTQQSCPRATSSAWTQADPGAVRVLADLVGRLFGLGPEVCCERQARPAGLRPGQVAVGVCHNDQKD